MRAGSQRRHFLLLLNLSSFSVHPVDFNSHQAINFLIDHRLIDHREIIDLPNVLSAPQRYTKLRSGHEIYQPGQFQCILNIKEV
jgi:hypothetical protein